MQADESNELRLLRAENARLQLAATEHADVLAGLERRNNEALAEQRDRYRGLLATLDQERSQHETEMGNLKRELVAAAEWAKECDSRAVVAMRELAEQATSKHHGVVTDLVQEAKAKEGALQRLDRAREQTAHRLLWRVATQPRQPPSSHGLT